ncbi:hypothetical protein M422DRAFT_255651 [Sphaerobolus stellatus SS14]|uniref:Unplaced genomic scaffold SPHSTscaffold_62, whole genome shotgun sequence n=1 Tax=Sphaerobolus stellatus (strain SS14) TaxID=990650 RepID=A0A0C9VIV4_SPHS4|nr:hypothetical protein M422DRAFT_255651 [Sphaerobolus stellatus SS14]
MPPKGSQKNAKKLSDTKEPKSRQQDPVDPSLIISGTCTRKPISCAQSKQTPELPDGMVIPDDDSFQMSPGPWPGAVSKSPTTTNFSFSTDGVTAKESVPVKVGKSAKQTGANYVEKRDGEDPNKALKEVITLHTPIKNSSGNTCITKIKIPTVKSFEDVRTIIHDEIGCGDIPEHHFPDLLLHFLKDTKSTVWPLNCEKHWEDAKENWELEVTKKKHTSCVNVQLDLKKLKNAHPKGNSQASKAASCAKAVDFYAASDAEDDATMGYNETEFDTNVAAKQAELESILQDCNTCNAKKNPQDCIHCLINKNGFHKKLSHDMVKAWALSLFLQSEILLWNSTISFHLLQLQMFSTADVIGEKLQQRPPMLRKLIIVHLIIPNWSPGYGEYEYLPPPVCFMPPPMLPKKMYKAMGLFGDSSSPDQPQKCSHIVSCEDSSDSGSDVDYPAVKDWLKRFIDVKGAADHNLKHNRDRFEAQGCLHMPISKLHKVPDNFWGTDQGLKFNVAEIMLLKERLHKSLKAFAKDGKSMQKHKKS